MSGARLPAAVLFDMDGTLIDSEPLWLEAEHEVMAALGGSWSDADQAVCLGGPLERVVDYMIERAGSDEPAARVMTTLLDAMERRLRETPLSWRPGAQALLAECLAAGVPTALVSASWGRLIRAVASRIDEAVGGTAFAVVVAGDDVQNTKPHPEPYLAAARALGHEPADCLALEDSPTGVTSAVAAGCRVVAIPHIASIDTRGAVAIPTLEGQTLPSLWARVAT
jgi:HAD superfamily hydrolase (TIGR01509 family)